MKMKIFTLLMVALVSNAVNAATFDVSNFNISSRYGNNEQFKWSARALGGSRSITLNSTGDSQAFAYGVFRTNDFRISRVDARDNNDHFRSSIDLNPPGTAVSDFGAPDAFFQRRRNGYVDVDFDNTYQTFAFGNGGIVGLKFLDTRTLSRNGRVNLRARLKLIRAETIAAVPAPSALLLMGSGLIGIATAARRKAKA